MMEFARPMWALILVATLLSASCSSDPALWNGLSRSEGEKHTGFKYIPLDPLAVEYENCENDSADYAKILDYLPDNAVRISMRKLSGGIEFNAAAFGVGKEGERYRVVIDYVNFDNTNLQFELEFHKDDTDDGNNNPLKSEYTIRRLIEGDTSPGRKLPTAWAFPHIYRALGIKPKRSQSLPPGKIVFVLPVYVGVGLRLTAEIGVLHGQVNLSSLPGIAASVKAGNAAGSLVVQTLGVTGKHVSTGLLFSSDLNETTVQNAILSLGKIKALLYSKDTIIRPRVTGMYLPLSDGTDPFVNAIVSELARKPIKWEPQCTSD